jgi:hypothetical protein
MNPIQQGVDNCHAINLVSTIDIYDKLVIGAGGGPILMYIMFL